MTLRKPVQRVAAKAVVKAKGAILILHPSSIDPNKKWHIPGGIRDDINESLNETLIRELKEETGIDATGKESKVIKIGEWTARDKDEQAKVLGVFFLIKLSSRPEVVLGKEHDDFVWVNLSNLCDYEVNKDVAEVVEMLY
jgi:ADP-ribose pyrophosphatase YjhB (NUDIX family)